MTHKGTKKEKEKPKYDHSKQRNKLGEINLQNDQIKIKQ